MGTILTRRRSAIRVAVCVGAILAASLGVSALALDVKCSIGGRSVSCDDSSGSGRSSGGGTWSAPDPQPPPPDPEAMRRAASADAARQGLEALRAGEWETAAAHFRDALRYLPDDAAVRTHLREAERQAALATLQDAARAALGRQDWDGAVVALERALALSPHDARLQRELAAARGGRMNARGVDYLRAGEYNRALQAFADALKLLPGDRAILANREATLDQMRAASWRVENERRERERAAQEATQKAAEAGVHGILDARTDQVGGGHHLSLDGLAARQAEQADRVRPGALEDPSLLRIPFDSSAPLEPDPVEIKREQPAGDRKDPGPAASAVPLAAKALQQRIDVLAARSVDLERQIRQEQDPVKRVRLLDQQTRITSEKRVLEIQYVDVLVRPPAATTPPARK